MVRERYETLGYIFVRMYTFKTFSHSSRRLVLVLGSIFLPLDYTREFVCLCMCWLNGRHTYKIHTQCMENV